MNYLLHLEDDPDDVLIFRQTLKEIKPKLGYINFLEPNEGLKFLKSTEHIPCLILMDLNMPGITGKELLISLKSIDKIRNIPVAIMTTSSLPSDYEFCKRYCDAYFIKPLTVEQFEPIIHSIAELCEPEKSYRIKA